MRLSNLGARSEPQLGIGLNLGLGILSAHLSLLESVPFANHSGRITYAFCLLGALPFSHVLSFLLVSVSVPEWSLYVLRAPQGEPVFPFVY